VALGKRGSILLLHKGSSTETARKIRTTLTTRAYTTRTCIATTTTFPTNFPTMGWGHLIVRHPVDIIIKTQLEGSATEVRAGLGREKRGKP